MTDPRNPRNPRNDSSRAAGASSTPEHEEFVPEDDAIIGVAFRRSLIGLAVIAGIVIVTIIVLRRETATLEVVVDKNPSDIEPLNVVAPDLPVVRFTDITAAAGIDFVHFNGATGEKLLPETMGGGCAFFDYDNDGDADLLLVNSAGWPHNPAVDPAPTSKLYANDGAGRFTDVTAAAGLGVTCYGMGAAVGDFDNDGDADLFIAAVGRNRFLRNDGGIFTELTDSAGLAGDPAGWSSSAGWLDYDNDGDLDLFVCNYVKWSREIDIELDFRMDGIGRAYGPPTHFEGAQPYLYRNEGDGSLTEVGESAGLHTFSVLGLPVAKALATTFVDVDGNGFIDILLANDTTPNFLYMNRGDGTFTEAGAAKGVAYDPMGETTGAMGIDAVNYRNDNALAVAIGNFANEPTSFYVTQPGGTFFDESIGAGVGSPSRQALSFGLFFFDYDLDGRLDLLQANGHIEDEINRVQSSQHYRQPSQLFWNAGPDAARPMEFVPGQTTGDFARPIVGRGAAYADIDGDGDVDVLFTQIAGPPLLLRNDQDLGHHWLRVHLTGSGRGSNRDAIGAWVTLVTGGADGVVQRRQVMPTRSYLSQVEPTITFGLGDVDAVESLTITWPDGTKQTVAVEGVDRTLHITQE